MSISRRPRTYNNSKSSELVDFKRFYAILRRYIWLIALCVISGVGTAYYLVYEYMLPVYRSNSTIIIEGTSQNYANGDSDIGNIISSSYNLNTNQTIESEIQFLKSRELSEEVAMQILAARYLPDRELYPLLWSQYPKDSTLVPLSELAGRIRSGLKIEPKERGSNILSISFESYSPEEAYRVVNYSLNAYQDITAEKKRASAESALAYLTDQKNKWGSRLEETENELSGFRNNQNLVSIQSQTSNLVNTVSALETQKQEMAIRLESVKSGIENHEKQLAAIRPRLGERYSQAIGPRISSYQQELAKLETERLILISNNPQLESNYESEPTIQRLDKRINVIKTEVKRLTDNLMSVEDGGYLGLLAGSDGSITQEISNIQAQLTKLKLEESQLIAQLDAIDTRLQNNQKFLESVPENQKRLERLRRQVSIYEEMYLTVSKKENEVRVWEQTRRGPGTIVDFASIPSAPVKPEKLTWLLAGFMIGLFLPVLTVTLKETLNSRLSSLQDFENFTHPLLAVFYDHSLLDKVKAKDLIKDDDYKKGKQISDDIILYHYGMSPVAESYRSLVSKVLFSKADQHPQTIFVTSPNSSEGKTTLLSNIAVAFTEVGKRVLIIDCDLRKPQIHEMFGISRVPGLMEYFFGENSIREVIKNTRIQGLDIMTTGKTRPARPNAVIGSESFKYLIQKLKNEYDIILLDTAPFGIVGDIAPIIQQTDGVIVNSKFRSTKLIELDHTLEQLEHLEAKIIGLTLNSYKPHKSIDRSEVVGLYSKKYSEYYDYHQAGHNEKYIEWNT